MLEGWKAWKLESLKAKMICGLLASWTPSIPASKLPGFPAFQPLIS
jgi:hypothetical protein